MNRRHFIKSTGTTLILPSLSGAILPNLWRNTFFSSKEQWTEWLKDNDRRIGVLLQRQEKKPGHRYFGGHLNDYEIHTPGGTASMIQHMSVAYTSKESAYYGEAELEKAMLAASNCLLKMQHPDGAIDLYSTNFHSTPDTGFVVEPACLAYSILKSSGQDKTLSNLQAFLVKAGEALSVGGIHTPNHRWVVCMALARINRLFPNERYLKRINEWLYEKIDIDPDGQYTEKSTHVYSPLTDRCLITIARLLDRPTLYEPVRKNLEMSLYYVHANGEIVTEASGRQDRYQIGHLDPYYYPYRYMALLDGNPRFSSMCRLIEATAPLHRLSNKLPYFLEDAGLRQTLPASAPLPDNYFQHYPYSDLVRIRRKEIDATILAQNSTIFTFFKGKAVLQAVRLASAFFGKGQFEADHLQIVDGRMTLRQELSGPYYQPYPIDALPVDGNWEKMPRKNRPKSEVQFFRTTINIEETASGQFELQFDIQGTDEVPLAIELGFRPGGRLSGVREIANIPDAYFLEEGFGKYESDGQTIEFGPGRQEHKWTQLRGAKPKLNAESVYLTGFTPFQFTLQIR